MNTQCVAGLDWSALGEKLKKHWGFLTDADLARANHNLALLAGIIQDRTGRERNEIQQFLDGAVRECTSQFDRISENARRVFADVGTTCAETIGPASEMVFRQARTRPFEVVCGAFGLGILVGAAVGLLIHESAGA